MMNTRTLLLDSAERIFADHCDKPTLDRAEQGEFPDGLMALIRENGFQQLAMPESGVALEDALAVLKVAGRYALPLPLAEIVLANRWLGSDERFVSIGLTGSIEAETEVWEVPWGRRADLVIGVTGSGEAVLRSEFDVVTGHNMAGEPRDRIHGGRSERLNPNEDPFMLLALSRVMLMAGGLEKALSLSLSYVNEREQFGRPIARFQAIQHHMAVMAAEVAAAMRAADAALEGLGTERSVLEIAAAKARVGESVGVVAELAQQVHGAMGYTYEHQLHHTTRRLWSWRDEFGTESHWQKVLGRHVARVAAKSGANSIWAFIATRG